MLEVGGGGGVGGVKVRHPERAEWNWGSAHQMQKKGGEKKGGGGQRGMPYGWDLASGRQDERKGFSDIG